MMECQKRFEHCSNPLVRAWAHFYFWMTPCARLMQARQVGLHFCPFLCARNPEGDYSRCLSTLVNITKEIIPGWLYFRSWGLVKHCRIRDANSRRAAKEPKTSPQNASNLKPTGSSTGRGIKTIVSAEAGTSPWKMGCEQLSSKTRGLLRPKSTKGDDSDD